MPVLFFALLATLCTAGAVLLPVLPALLCVPFSVIAIHELSHWLAARLLGARPHLLYIGSPSSRSSLLSWDIGSWTVELSPTSLSFVRYVYWPHLEDSADADLSVGGIPASHHYSWSLLPFGGSCGYYPGTYAHGVLIALAGPLSNAMVVLLCLLAYAVLLGVAWAAIPGYVLATAGALCSFFAESVVDTFTLSFFTPARDALAFHINDSFHARVSFLLLVLGTSHAYACIGSLIPFLTSDGAQALARFHGRLALPLRRSLGWFYLLMYCSGRLISIALRLRLWLWFLPSVLLA